MYACSSKPTFPMRNRRLLTPAFLAGLLLGPGAARASFLSGDALAAMADVVTWVVLIVVPLGAIVVFWLVHILPEVIAEKHHHPQKEAIKTLCLLSLVFGGMLWPAAWLWAYTRPVMFRAAYGTEKHEDYYTEMADKARAGQLLRADIAALRGELEAIAEKGRLPAKLQGLLAELERLHAEAAETPPPEGKA